MEISSKHANGNIGYLGIMSPSGWNGLYQHWRGNKDRHFICQTKSGQMHGVKINMNYG